jgi:hypothetical protein
MAAERRSICKPLVLHGPGARARTNLPNPTIEEATDVVGQDRHSTICGSDFHIPKGDVPEAMPGEGARLRSGVGTIVEEGALRRQRSRSAMACAGRIDLHEHQKMRLIWSLWGA